MADEVTFTGQSGMTWRYWEARPLGTPGGFGGVYPAEAPDGSPMAVKVVKKQRPPGALDDRLLRREIEIGKRVAESGSQMLLPVIDAADAGDALLLVMPLAEGGALADASIPLAETEAVPVLVDIATGLQDLHSTLIFTGTSSPPTSCATRGGGSSPISGSPATRKSGPRTRPSRAGNAPPIWRPNCGAEIPHGQDRPVRARVPRI